MSSSPVIPREDHESLKQSEMFIHGRVNERECNLGGWGWGGERKFFWVQVCPCIVCMCLKDRNQPFKHFAVWDSVSQWPRFCQLVSTDWKHTPEITLSPPHQHWIYSPRHDGCLFTGVLDTKIRSPSNMRGTLLTELSLNPKLLNFETNNEFLWKQRNSICSLIFE